MKLRNKGAALSEYGIVAGLISVVSITAVYNFSETVSEVYSSAEIFLSDKLNADTRTGEALVVDTEYPSLDPILPYGYTSKRIEIDDGYVSYASSGEEATVDVNFGTYTVVSGPFFASMINRSGEVTLEGNESATMSIDGGPSITSGIIEPNMSLRIRMKPSSNYSDTREVRALIEGEPFVVFSTTTRDYPDLVADSFVIADIVGAVPGDLVAMNPVTISGIEVNRAPSETMVGQYVSPVRISGEGNPQIRIEGGSWSDFGEIGNGEKLEVRMTASDQYSDRRGATVSVGNVHVMMSVTTQDLSVSSNPFGNQDRDLGNFYMSDHPPLFGWIDIDPSWSSGFTIVEQPPRFAKDHLRITADPANNRINLYCDDDKECKSYNGVFDVIIEHTGSGAIASEAFDMKIKK
jgi:Flp pilus assembly pilin Flp